ncbi:MAG: dynamin family protein [Bacteroidaceae bacterium]|nr:dynamin family protein [Bacteroidaceae bacterium]
MSTNINLNNLPIGTLTAIAEQLQRAVESVLNNMEDSELPAQITNQCKRLLCRSQEWHSKAFFVIVVGPVKSGKSTFVNLLAHEKVSPTHFLECTVRPSIISRKTGENEDSLITPFLTEGNPTIEHVDTIIDYIKGLEYADLCNVKIEKPCVLNDENLDKKISYRTGFDLGEKEKIVLTAITAKGGEFLQNNIYMIDMPGFDGVMANLNASFYEAIVNRADLVVFVQSSNSAINKISEDFCTMIQKRNGLVPIFFIHNYFDSAYWHTEEERRRVTRGHIEKALDFFEEQKLLVKEENCYCINLGKVTDARNIEKNICIPEYNDMLMKEDGSFSDIEHILYQKISASQNKMRLQNCINRTIREAELLGELLSKCKEELVLLKQEYDEINRSFDKLRAAIQPIVEASVLNIDEKYPELIAQLKDIRKTFCEKIDYHKKYNTDSTREKARELIRMYRTTTESFVKCIFNPKSILQNVHLMCNTSFNSAIPPELKKYDVLFTAVWKDGTSIEIDYSSIDKVYDVEKRIKKWNFKTRKGEDVIECMIDIEHALFGLSPEKACGFITQQFFAALKNEIENWIGLISQGYRSAHIEKVEKAREMALAEKISDIIKHETEKKQLDVLIKGVRGILKSEFTK